MNSLLNGIDFKMYHCSSPCVLIIRQVQILFFVYWFTFKIAKLIKWVFRKSCIQVLHTSLKAGRKDSFFPHNTWESKYTAGRQLRLLNKTCFSTPPGRLQKSFLTYWETGKIHFFCGMALPFWRI